MWKPRTLRQRLGAAAIAVVAAVPVLTLVIGNSAEAADAMAGDGTTSATAGASCWGIKQAFPASANGTYWLNTAALDRPQQFSCDMTTNGGGWVLVARGRQGWTFNPLGQGSPATVRGTIDGPGAFAPAALSTETIGALLNGTRLNLLADGIRIERATNSSGTSRQNYTLFPKFRSWSWNLPVGQLLTKVTIDGTTYSGSNTRDTNQSVAGQTTNALSGSQGTRRMFTWAWSSHNNKAGFSFGTGVNGGSNSASNYLWTNGSEGSPIPFTRVWIRPQIANSAAGFTPIPAAGYPAEREPVALNNRSELAPWGVEGLDHTGESTIEPWNSNVFTIRSHQDRVFVGGRFNTVRRGPGGSTTAQKYLAAFDLDGNWISTFRPTVNGRVWDMIITPDNKLIIAGDFTSVNGVANTSGMAALNPTTGEVITTWKATVSDAGASRPLVRALDQHNGTIYAAGRFTRVSGGNWDPIQVTNAVSVSAADGSPGTWRPRPSGQVVRIDVTDDASRVLLAGYFTNINGDANNGHFGITDIATGNPIAGLGTWTPSTGTAYEKRYQQAIVDVDGRIIEGGSQHNIQLWNRNRTQMIDSHITRDGGDTQALEVFDGKAYFGCHCGDYIYEGTNNFTTPTGFRSIEPLNLVGAIDTTTFEYDTTWFPNSLKGDRGEGVWAVEQDSRSCIWVGGDLNRGAWSGNATTDYLGGFARFCPADATPPTTPTNFAAVATGGTVKLTWGASNDASGTVSYDVYKDDRVIATVWGTSYTDTSPTPSARYTVRAVDARGNQSASPAPVTVNGPAPVIATVLPFGSTWRYEATGTNLGTAWRSPTFADTAWPSGPGKLGWGRPDVVTTVGATKPLTSYYRSTFQVAAPTSVRQLELSLSVATGAVVYVNGVEAGRINMPAGAIAATSTAAGYVSGAAETDLKVLQVPSSLLVAGTNSIAVEVHNMAAGGSRAFLDVQAIAYGAGGDAVAPSAPVLSATSGASGVGLSWTPATDDAALGGYLIARDGQKLAVTGALATAYLDGEADAAESHTYVVTAFDRNGNTTASNTVTVAGSVNPNLLTYGSSWRWFYAEGGPAAGWTSASFDDSTWASGAAEFGYGDNDEKTVISTAPTPRPLTAYFRTTVNVTDPAAFSAVLASLIRDDGAVVYVNGVEVGRDNLPAGPVAFATPASTILSDRAAELAPVTFTIPVSAFQAGANTIAVEVHNSDRWSGDLSLDLKLTGQP